MISCDYCKREIEGGKRYYELKVNATAYGRPIPLVFMYCSYNCYCDDYTAEIKIAPMVEGDAE
jgi:hypothetical protein